MYAVPGTPQPHDRPRGNCPRCKVELGDPPDFISPFQRSSPLADIFVQCPRTGAPISTGLKSEWVLLESLPRIPIPVRCPACGQMHKWMPQDAWMGPVLPSHAPMQFSGSRGAP